MIAMPGWVTDVAPKVVISSSQYGNVIRDRVVHQFNSVAERDATAEPRIGMLCYCYAEHTYYAYLNPYEWWNPGAPYLGPLWCVFDTGWVEWDAQVWSGPTTVWTIDAAKAGYRRTLNTCEVHVQHTGVSITATLDTDLIYIPPPVPTEHSSVVGVFGSAFLNDPIAGGLGPLAQFDATHLAIGLLHNEGTGTGANTRLVVRGDLSDTAGAKFDMYMHGSYPCALT